MFVAALAAAALMQAAPAASVHAYGALSLSPAGDKIATVESVTGGDKKPHGVVTLRNLKGAVSATVDPCDACRYTDTAWSPDGKTLAVIASDAKAGTVTLYAITGGKATALTTIKGLMAHPSFSPDGQSIAVLAVVNPHKQVGATQAGARQVGEIDVAQVIDEQRIGVVPVSGGDLKLVTPDDSWVYEYDWTPDSKGFVATSSKGDGDANWWVARLVSLGLDGSMRVIAAPDMQMNYPRISADGKTVYVIGGLMSDFGSVGGDVYSVPFDGGTPVDVTPDAKVTFTSLTLTQSGPLATIITGGETGVARLDPAKKTYNVISHAEVSARGMDFDAAGKTAAAVVSSFSVAPHIEAGLVGSMQVLTHDNDAMKPAYTAKSITWSNEGFSVQGWLMAPANIEPGKKYPMVTIVHGGPSAAYTSGFATEGTVADLLKAGYYVFEPNPRGSYGQGEAFVLSNKRDFGGGDLRDILAGIDAIEKQAPVDDNRLGIMGHSYGGLMTMWTVTQSHRFKAAVAGAGIANWSSYYGENGINTWMIPFFGASFYDDPAIYDKLSPIRYIKNAQTPTFIYVGELDVECPAAQSLEFFRGLKAMNVPTSLVIYADQGHGIYDGHDRKDIADRELAWFDKYLK
ncbi:MAG TPA: S9 family peptidase [Asticcacaulis sp.]|nr:S9 family peptidase [Asticcacaulis sp.]